MNEETMPFIVSTPRQPEKPSLRDQFAMAALTGMLSRKEITSCNNGYWRLREDVYEIADAMIAEVTPNLKLHK